MYSVGCSYNIYSGYGTHADTLDGAIVKAAWARDYYEALYPGTVRIQIEVACKVCKGDGRVGKGRKNVRFPKYKDCACCKARGYFPIPAVV